MARTQLKRRERKRGEGKQGSVSVLGDGHMVGSRCVYSSLVEILTRKGEKIAFRKKLWTEFRRRSSDRDYLDQREGSIKATSLGGK